jgi:hypothetical protein
MPPQPLQHFDQQVGAAGLQRQARANRERSPALVNRAAQQDAAGLASVVGGGANPRLFGGENASLTVA